MAPRDYRAIEQHVVAAHDLVAFSSVLLSLCFLF